MAHTGAGTVAGAEGGRGARMPVFSCLLPCNISGQFAHKVSSIGSPSPSLSGAWSLSKYASVSLSVCPFAIVVCPL